MANIERFTREESMYGLIREWQNSSSSKKRFCDQAQVGIHTFNYWLKKFKDKSVNPGTEFTEFKITDRNNPSSIRLNFPNGVVAELPANYDYKLVHFLINSCQ
jgi:hypothetical protein